MTSQPKLDLYKYVPFYLRSVANRLTQIDRRLYSISLDVGLNEWVCLALLAREDRISASRICEVSGYDKAVISRSIRSLIDKKWVTSEGVPNHNRKQLLSLTDEGLTIYRKVESLVLERERRLLADISDEEREQLLSLLSRLLVSADHLLDANT